LERYACFEEIAQIYSNAEPQPLSRYSAWASYRTTRSPSAIRSIFIPFLIFCLLVFLRRGGVFLARTYRVMIGLVLVSITVNSLATVSWLVDSDQNVRPETRAIWNRFLGALFAGRNKRI